MEDAHQGMAASSFALRHPLRRQVPSNMNQPALTYTEILTASNELGYCSEPETGVHCDTHR